MTAPPFYSKTLDFSLSYIIYSIALGRATLHFDIPQVYGKISVVIPF